MPRKKIKRKASQCIAQSNGVKCNGRYILEYDGNIPIFKCDTCGDLNLTWKKFYNEYLNLFKQKENWDDKKHQVSCIIGFFCYCYKNFYGIDYIFSPSSVNPYSSKECRDALVLVKTFNDAGLVRKYIHWFFNKFINSSTEISSLGYLISPGIIRKYNLYRHKNVFMHRSTSLPETFVSWCKDNISVIFDKYSLETMNDLGAILNFCKTQNIDENSCEFKLIEEANKIGLIKNNELNIKD